MKYIQKAPITSFRGVLEFNKNIWRPLLKFSKKDILEYANFNKLNWVYDSTNENLNYLRNKIRIEEIPKIKNKTPHLISELFQKKDQALKLFKIAETTKESFILLLI
jgi:tRNA(Ile)-lysidine synthase